MSNAGGYPRSEQLRDFVPSFVFGDRDACTYCGDTPVCLDHVIPLSSYSVKARNSGSAEPGVRTYACESCNLRLGAKVFQSFEERMLHVKELLMKDSRKFSRDASWSDDELAELDYTLQTYVKTRQMAMRLCDEKVQWQGSQGHRQCLATLHDVACLKKDAPLFIEWLAVYFGDYVPSVGCLLLSREGVKEALETSSGTISPSEVGGALEASI